MKKSPVLAGLISGLAMAVIIVADYLALFGTTEKVEYVLQEARIRPFDASAKTPINGARAKCFQKGNSNACTQRDSGRLGIVSVMVPTTRISRKSLLFDQGHHFLKSDDPKIQVMLIHLDYVNQVESIEIDDLISKPGEIYKVMMQPRHYKDAGNS